MRFFKMLVLILVGTVFVTAGQYLFAAEWEPPPRVLKKIKGTIEKLIKTPVPDGDADSLPKSGLPPLDDPLHKDGNNTSDLHTPEDNTSDIYTPAHAAQDLKGIVPDPKPYLAHIVKTSNENESMTLAVAIDLLDILKPGSSREVLLEILVNGPPEKRSLALYTLGDKFKPDEVQKYAVPLITDNDEDVRKWALKVLDSNLTRIPDIAKLVIEKTRSDEIPDRAKTHAARLLGKIKGPSAEKELLRLSESDVHELRLEAVGTLGYSKSEQAVDRLIVAIEEDDSPEIRKTAVIGIARSGSEDAARALVYALGDEDANVRKTAANALRNISGTNMGESKGLWEKWQTARETYPDGNPPIEIPESVFPGKDKRVLKPKEKEASFILVLIVCLVLSALVYIGLWKLFTSLGFQMQPGVLNISDVAKLVILGIFFIMILLFLV